jgi:tetrapyrrole methylase family protein/MazG family protein
MHTNEIEFTNIVGLMKRLRSETGCPWDRKQTVESLTPYLLEECHELREALANGDREHISEECGDLLFQIVFLSEIFAEEGSFTINDVLTKLNDKMIRRHPHVFGETAAGSVEAVLSNWEKIKASERKEKRASVLDGVPKTLPALSQALALQHKAARVGFDWKEDRDVLGKIQEEFREFQEAEQGHDPLAMRDEFGDLLFALVNYARKKEIDPELALVGTIQKFIARFRYIEEALAARGKKPEDSTLEEMDALWDKAKASL